MIDALHTIWVGLQGLMLLALCGLLYLVVKQQGRLLLRLDAIEQHLGTAAAEASQAPGMGVGTPLPGFRLPDLDGRMVALEDFRGKRVLLVHWGPGCGFCERIAPDLARLDDELKGRDVRLVLASRDGAGANRDLADEHGLRCPILLMKEEESPASDAFLHQGTPVAYLLDERGAVARPLAVGGEAILSLAREAAGDPAPRKRLPNERPLSESRLVRDGLKAGTPAPTFVLPEVRGGTVDLADYRGRPVLLVFTDPQCAPCEELAPQLARMQGRCRDEGLGLILVARGDAEAVRRKASDRGFTSPVALQDGWKLSKEYGIFAVPVAFLIGEDGAIAADVARGPEEILALLRRGLAAGKVPLARS